MGFAALGFAAVVFDSAAPGPGDLNFFDGALCDAVTVVLPGCFLTLLPDFFAAALRVLAAGVLAEIFDRARAGFGEGDFADFLRVFLDIRLPFVAFGGSIIGVLLALSWHVGIKPTAGQV